ncbi:hypothetical protein POPTR_016G034501v4 [Populus trichocarpa]|uniref:Uncharacterized protein n=1 Tax=Populus trichocarpa TaxID=3694 RepID=A0A2K1XA54_POPTR|nr:hypothetical protein POPTR_016G034501v4 [Populus trichocarpa]
MQLIITMSSATFSYHLVNHSWIFPVTLLDQGFKFHHPQNQYKRKMLRI